MATAALGRFRPITALGNAVYQTVAALGDLALFAGRALAWTLRRRPAPGTLLGSCFEIGVRSVPVVAVTGIFIGMVLAVQSYSQFAQIGLGSRLGGIINLSVIRELGPVLAATMLAGRVGGAMAAELATMRITEQVDALACLGANPLHYLVVPRFLACLLLIPLLTLLADFMGILGGALMCLRVFHVEGHHYWQHAREAVGAWDLLVSLVKPMFFGAAIALLRCHRGLNSRPGAEGVGRAATEAFVISFIAVLLLDFLLAVMFNTLYDRLWPSAGAKLFS